MANSPRRIIRSDLMDKSEKSIVFGIKIAEQLFACTIHGKPWCSSSKTCAMPGWTNDLEPLFLGLCSSTSPELRRLLNYIDDKIWILESADDSVLLIEDRIIVVLQWMRNTL
uniref:Uncharacterized protein n=1 Tax=Romanomermis culicivorax TaxID=13658 RepID=A0A915I0I2_ROMCU